MKKILLILLAFCLVGCTNKPDKPKNYKYTLEYYYLDTCPKCKEFKKVGIPMIEEEFGDDMQIIEYNLDELSDKEKKHYDDIIKNIVGFDDQWYGYAPFVVLDGYFAKLGIGIGNEKEFLEDLKKAVSGKPLGTELADDRYLFKDTKVVE